MIALLAFFCSSVNAQDSTRHNTFGVRIGMAGIHIKDEFQSPYTYKGTNFQFGLSYVHTTPRHQHEFAVDLLSGHLQSAVSPRGNGQIGFFSYDYFFQKRKLTHKLDGQLGLGLHAVASRINYLPEVELPVTYLTAGGFLALDGRLRYQLSPRSALELNASVSTVGVVYRPDFDINGKSSTRAAYLGNSLFYTVKVAYVYQVNPKLDLTLGYRYQYFTYREPRPIYLSQHSLYVGVRVKG